jgi:nicotinamide-nucleotide amidase
VFDRAFITYTNAAKIQMLGVLPATLDAYGAVSEAVAREMAAGALRNSDADIAVAITGIAGPGGSDHKPEGRVCFGVATSAGVRTETVEFGAQGRANVRTAARDHALALLLRAVEA